MTVKLLVDTDIGSDIDDALALAYLLARPDCELLGITTVTGDVDARARLATAVCQAAGKYVPTVPGATMPVRGEDRQPDVPQAAALGRWPHDVTFPTISAARFLAERIHESPGEVVLLTLGPLTNVARLLKEDPVVATELRLVITMGGWYTGPGRDAEWNIWCDPEAAEVVFRTELRRHLVVGLDVTNRLEMAKEDLSKVRRTGPLTPVLDFADVWFRNEAVVTFHDPLAAVLAFDESICSFERGTIEVTTRGAQEGMTSFDSPGGGPQRDVAFDVRPAGFFKQFWAPFAL